VALNEFLNIKKSGTFGNETLQRVDKMLDRPATILIKRNLISYIEMNFNFKVKVLNLVN